MAPINCIIVDDNEIDRLIVEEYLQDYPEFKLTGSFCNPLESVAAMQQQNIAVVFMDIDMPVMNGIDFFKTVNNPPLCIFITSHPDYATDAFEVHALDYLVKPLDKQRFDRSVNRLKELLQIKAKALHYDLQFERDTLTIKEGTAITRINMQDIIYLEAITNYTRIVTPSKKHITLSNLKNLMDQLPDKKFIRIHRSYAVAVDKIERIENKELFAGLVALPIGKTYRSSISSFMIRKPLQFN
ncbi:LytR/AlgR family response regulator transcription factor [Foetidibacter luteolus]|uniref:LytR/AlgR family response regulator transcription factor n=1 Tax=Foetidibacter luteolus TaxID=2608880 RepID=UPI00129B39AC|nr:LytTR family DNA-binding domain-containing protein [Foetidibacter luteolus]